MIFIIFTHLHPARIHIMLIFEKYFIRARDGGKIWKKNFLVSKTHNLNTDRWKYINCKKESKKEIHNNVNQKVCCLPMTIWYTLLEKLLVTDLLISKRHKRLLNTIVTRFLWVVARFDSLHRKHCHLFEKEIIFTWGNKALFVLFNEALKREFNFMIAYNRYSALGSLTLYRK